MHRIAAFPSNAPHGSPPSGAEVFKGFDDFLLEILHVVGIAQVDALAGGVLDEFLEMEGPLAMGEKLHR